MSVCKEMMRIGLLGPEAAGEISEVPLSSDTISHRVSDISSDIKVILKGKNLISGRYSLFRTTSPLTLVVTLNLSPTSDTWMEI
jgi:hypothetical protein